MDVIFETQKGAIFTIEVGYFDTISEIKQRILKHKEIPVAHQTLVFNGRVLDDDSDIEKSQILHNSRLRLIIGAAASPSPEKPKIVVKTEQLSPSPAPASHPPPPPIARRIQILLRLPSSPSQPSVEVDLNDTVEQLKEKIVTEIEGIPANRLVLQALGSIEMQDHKHICDYNLTDGSEVDVSIRPVPGAVPVPSLIAPGTRKLRVFVLPKCGTKKIAMEVNPTDKIQVLRSELEKLKQRAGLQLPPEGYFFICNQNVMEDKESFAWNRIRHGDTIEIFNGSVSGGS